MTEQNKLDIKLELIRDKSTGDLAILAHFDSKATNVFLDLDKNEYIWIPTLEEKNLLNDAFNFFSSRYKLKEVETKETEIMASLPEKIPSEESLCEKIPQDYTKSEEKTEELSFFEKKEKENEESAIFEATEEKILSEKTDNEHKKEEPMDVKVDIKSGEPEKERQTEEKKYEEEIIVEAEGEAVEAALKKHTRNEYEDSNLVQGDEQTIIDKILNQKKKTRWPRK